MFRDRLESDHKQYILDELRVNFDAIEVESAIRKIYQVNIPKKEVKFQHITNWEALVDHIRSAEWYLVLELTEILLSSSLTKLGFEALETSLNEYFCNQGIGYLLSSYSKITPRTSEIYQVATVEALDLLQVNELKNSEEEFRLGLKALSMRPSNVTGCIDHTIKALESTARHVVGSKGTFKTLGFELEQSNFFNPEIKHLWLKFYGYVSENSRHMSEKTKVPSFDEAELVVTMAAGLCVYILRKHGQQQKKI